MTLIPCCIHGGKYINSDGTVNFELYNRVIKNSFESFIKETDILIQNKKTIRLKSYGFDVSYKDICMDKKHYI